MAGASPHHGIDENAVVCHEEKSLGIAVESARISKSCGKLKDVSKRPVRVRIPLRAGDADRLIECDNDRTRGGTDDLAVRHDVIAASGIHLLSRMRDAAVHRHSAGFNQAVRIAPRAQPAVCKIGIEPHLTVSGFRAGRCLAVPAGRVRPHLTAHSAASVLIVL